MRDDFQAAIENIETLEGATPAIFPRVFLAGDAGSETRRDAASLAAALAGTRAAAISMPEQADLVVVGSAADATPGWAVLDPSDRPLLDRAACPVAAAPRGLSGRDDYMPRRIDVGVDGSRGAAAALATSVRIARQRAAHLLLIAIAETRADPGGTDRRGDPREIERLSRHLEHAVADISAVALRTELREGVPDQTLVEFAADADLLVLGSRAAYGGGDGVVIGDVASRVLRGCPCPTLIVPSP
jgi:nucleotide-binding universal stress UspA family protein